MIEPEKRYRANTSRVIASNQNCQDLQRISNQHGEKQISNETFHSTQGLLEWQLLLFQLRTVRFSIHAYI